MGAVDKVEQAQAHQISLNFEVQVCQDRARTTDASGLVKSEVF